MEKMRRIRRPKKVASRERCPDEGELERYPNSSRPPTDESAKIFELRNSLRRRGALS